MPITTGFQLLVADNFMRGPEVVIRGAATHTAKAANTALGTIRSVEYTLQNLDEVAASLANSIADTQKHIADLAVQTTQPFEYEERLIALVRRQQEIADALDLTKNQAPQQLAAEAPIEPTFAEAESACLA